MPKNKLLIALVGKAGSGKDSLARKLTACEGIHNIVSCTTRPMRENEQDGIDYHFLTNEMFAEKVLNGEMLEATYFNGWHYGTLETSLHDGVNVGVFNPAGWDCLSMFPIKDITLIGYFLDCNDKERLLRQLQREQNPDVHEIVRRFSADERDFEELSDKLIVLQNNNWDEQNNNYQRILQDIDAAGFKDNNR